MAIKIYSVKELTDLIDDILRSNFYSIWVEGEISSLRYSSTGHLYFSLIDEYASIGCLILRQNLYKFKTKPQEGKQVIVFGNISVYKKGGEYRLIVENLKEKGAGKKAYDLEQLKKEFKAKGYFDRKRPLPHFPKRIIVLTSPTGAAVEDIINIVNRRGVDLEILILPISVQGNQAKDSILNSLQTVNKIEEHIDVVVLARGGGSKEDLDIFNDPDIAKAFFDVKFPTISAIGHEIDFSLCDFVADRRAETPSAAAELITADIVSASSQINKLKNNLLTAINRIVSLKAKELNLYSGKKNYLRLKSVIDNKLMFIDRLSDNINFSISKKISMSFEILQQYRSVIEKHNPEQVISILKEKISKQKNSINMGIRRVIHTKQQAIEMNFQLMDKNNPLKLIKRNFESIEVIKNRLNSHINFLIDKKQSRLTLQTSTLKNLNPMSLLKRGYTITLDRTGKPIKSTYQIKEGEKLTTLFADGKVSSKIEKVERG
ncbi:exodeoxyribonuclease VII large subunit [Hippea jasoniae]|uniref:exodeoxyribonuclease VII large subunit n=1 Tax=Hippea jasoniae TaxID=944479 RepID=UPI0005577CC9|nr:exodeoxyribonuclease VII large subunit [Hippea jasoniae]